MDFPAVEPARYLCHRTEQPLTIDGRLDEESWKQAPRSDPFVDIVTGEAAWFETRVALLWDDRNLYIGFQVEETDIRASLTDRDSKIWFDNDVEVFIAGPDGYYELEINARNTIYEVLWIWEDALEAFSGEREFDIRRQPAMVLDGVGGHHHPRGRRWGFLEWDLPGLRHAVHLDGELNGHPGSSRGWTVELALPWSGLARIAGAASLPPTSGDVWRIDCSRFEQFDRDGNPLARSAGWTWNRHGHYDSHIPELFPYIHFSSQPVGR